MQAHAANSTTMHYCWISGIKLLPHIRGSLPFLETVVVSIANPS
ncbi:hypothetical protein M5D96_011234 [Drosophila gunungcola]|uniref:Uncharacterized protein n=1 Tax=Drosophila gunungcola TaxID=103775 RepID=A0A9P9YFX6_9MUSC|nr:hypothetical protein M5D96_011234 [Drosophila gunungcola]